MDAIAVDGEGKRREESLRRGEDVGSGHLCETGTGACATKWTRHVEPVHVVVEHFHGCLGINTKARPVHVHKVDCGMAAG